MRFFPTVSRRCVSSGWTRSDREGNTVRRRPAKTSYSFRRHAYRAVETDDLAVQHLVLEDVLDECGIFRRPAEARWEGHLLAEAFARSFGQRGHHRGVENP